MGEFGEEILRMWMAESLYHLELSQHCQSTLLQHKETVKIVYYILGILLEFKKVIQNPQQLDKTIIFGVPEPGKHMIVSLLRLQ